MLWIIFMILIPRKSAIKTKLTATNTFDMITTNIFLNTLFALWAFSCVFSNPILAAFLPVY